MADNNNEIARFVINVDNNVDNELKNIQKGLTVSAKSLDNFEAKGVSSLRNIHKEANKLEGTLRKTGTGSSKTNRLSEGFDALNTRLNDSRKSINKNQESIGHSSNRMSQYMKGLGATSRGLRLGKGFGQIAQTARFALSPTMGLAGGFALLGVGAYKLTSHIMDVSAEVKKNQQITQQAFGTSGEATKKLTAEGTALSRTFGDDYTSTISTAASLTQKFGLSSEEAFKLIEKGYLAGGNTGGEMLKQIDEYSVKLKGLGLNANQQIALISQSTKFGGTEQLVSLLDEFKQRVPKISAATRTILEDAYGKDFTKTFTKSIKEGKIETVEAVQTISKALSTTKLGDNKVQKAINELFGEAGAQAGFPLLSSLHEINLNLDTMVSKNTEFNSSLSDQLGWEKSIAEEQAKLSASWNDTGSLINKATNYLKFGFYKALNITGEKLSGLWDTSYKLLTLDFSGLYTDKIEKIQNTKKMEAGVNYYRAQLANGKDVSQIDTKLTQYANTQFGKQVQALTGISDKDALNLLKGKPLDKKEKPQRDLFGESNKDNRSGNEKASNRLNEGINQVMAGGKEVRHVTVNVQKFIGIETVNSSVQEATRRYGAGGI